MIKDYNTLFIGKVLKEIKECGSTNGFLKEMASRETLMEGTVLFTFNQTGGIGQKGNHWIDEQGKNLAFSCFLTPEFLNAVNLYVLNMAISLAVTELIHHVSSMPTYIKWPNDIMVGSKKISGILIENTIQGDRIKSSIAGIGININNDHFPQPLSRAVSIKQLTGNKQDMNEILILLMGFIDKWYLKLKRGSQNHLIKSYNQSLYLQGTCQIFKIGEQLKTGFIQEVSPLGELKVLIDGKPILFQHKEIELIP